MENRPGEQHAGVLKDGVDSHQGQHKAGYGHADKAQAGEQVVKPGVLFEGGDHPHGEGDHPDKDHGQQGKDGGHEQAAPDHICHIHVVGEGFAEVAVEKDVLHPKEVLDDYMLVQVVLLHSGLDHALLEGGALHLHLLDAGREEVARGKLDQDKDQNGDEEEEDHHSRQALKDVFEHKRASFPNQFLMYISSRVKLRMMEVRSPW